MAETAEKEAVRDSLAAHFVMLRKFDPSPETPPHEWVCQCGLKFGFSDTAIDHVTEQVQAAFRWSEAERGRLWEHLADRCKRAEATVAELVIQRDEWMWWGARYRAAWQSARRRALRLPPETTPRP